MGFMDGAYDSMDSAHTYFGSNLSLDESDPFSELNDYAYTLPENVSERLYELVNMAGMFTDDCYEDVFMALGYASIGGFEGYETVMFPTDDQVQEQFRDKEKEKKIKATKKVMKNSRLMTADAIDDYKKKKNAKKVIMMLRKSETELTALAKKWAENYKSELLAGYIDLLASLDLLSVEEPFSDEIGLDKETEKDKNAVIVSRHPEFLKERMFASLVSKNCPAKKEDEGVKAVKDRVKSLKEEAMFLIKQMELTEAVDKTELDKAILKYFLAGKVADKVETNPADAKKIMNNLDHKLDKRVDALYKESGCNDLIKEVYSKLSEEILYEEGWMEISWEEDQEEMEPQLAS